MHITQFTDYSLRVLLYTGLKEGKSTVAEIAKAFHVSRNHLVKVVHRLADDGLVVSHKGKGGGIELAPQVLEMKIGEIFKTLEPMKLVECFDLKTNECPIQGVCMLERSLYQARLAFIESLNEHTMGDFLKPGLSRLQRMKKLGLA